MNLIEYTPARFEALKRAAERIRANHALGHRPFVDYYYASRPWSKLHLFLSPSGDVMGTMGVEKMPFEFDGQPLILGFGSNFHALQPGVGGLLFMQWVKSSGLALEYGGSEDAHRIIRQQRWTYFPGVRLYTLNYDYPVFAGDRFHRRAAKWMLRHSTRKKLATYDGRVPKAARSRLSVREESALSDDILPSGTSFRFRLAPTVEYLSWRYSMQLSFVRYRLFRILSRGRTAGYVILRDSRGQLAVAHGDAEDPETLAYGVLLSVLQAGANDASPRSVLLACSHRAMAEAYMKFGFRQSNNDYPLAIGGLRKKIEMPTDTALWSVSHDWGDNGLLGPSPDQEIESQNIP